MAKAKFTPTYARFRQLLVQSRQSAGLTQVDVARRLKRHQSYVSKVESGERRLDVAEYIEFARAIGVDPVRLLKKLVSTTD